MRLRHLPLLTALVFAAGPVCGQAPEPTGPPAIPSPFAADPFAGEFADDLVALKIVRTGNSVAGTIRLDTRGYPLQGRVTAANRLEATYQVEDTTVPLAAEPMDGGLIVETGRARFQLLRKPAAAPSSPMVAPDSASASYHLRGTAILQPGRIVRREEHGFEFALPGAWTPRETADGSVRLERLDVGAVICFEPLPTATESTFVGQGRKGWEADSLRLVATAGGEPRSFVVQGGKARTVPVSGEWKSASVVGVVCGLFPDGPGVPVVVTVLAPKERYAEIAPVAEAVLRSVRLFPPTPKSAD